MSSYRLENLFSTDAKQTIPSKKDWIASNSFKKNKIDEIDSYCGKIRIMNMEIRYIRMIMSSCLGTLADRKYCWFIYVGSILW